MPTINLLPDELKPKSTTLKVSKKLRKVSILMFTILVISGIVVGMTVLLFANLLSISGKNQAQLKTQISNLQQTESRLVLIKDRLAKVGQLEKGGIVDAKVETLRNITESSGGDVNIREATLDKSSVVITASFPNSASLGRFLARITENNKLSSVRMDNLKYNQSRGYEITLTL